MPVSTWNEACRHTGRQSATLPNCRQRIGLQHKRNPSTQSALLRKMRSRTASPHPHEVTCRPRFRRHVKNRRRLRYEALRSRRLLHTSAEAATARKRHTAPTTQRHTQPGRDYAKCQNAMRPTSRPHLPPRSRAVLTAAKWPRPQSGRRGSRTPLAPAPTRAGRNRTA